ncbi:S9 family peptidase [Haloechinothrix halophila]|uniref:S9 family peptidase n=1 Tax=Haloechinothrix halophila TaxID=1069073 RepID=UPI00041D4A20|nr:prolyl oligopeptidase family serine peptidase [Haloechinothrix halophila]
MTADLSFLRKLARTQRFTLGAPKEFQVARDGSRVLYLRSGDGYDRTHSLWSLDVTNGTESKLVDAERLLPGEEELSQEERARRERSRESGGGVVRYAVDAACETAVFSLGGTLYSVDVASGAVAEHVSGAVIDPRLNPQGTHVAYAANGALRVIERASGADTVLAAEDDPQITWGVAEFIAAEEMNRSRGYWWSPDGTAVLAQRTDSTGVPRWNIADPANPGAPVNTVAYPAAGERNVAVSLRIIGLDGSTVDVERGDWEYLVAAHWSAGGLPLITVQPRDQRRLDILAIDVTDGSTSLVHSETDPAWVEIISGVPAWTPDGRLVRVEAADDSYQLVIDGKPVTDPGLQVRSVLHVGDEVLFSGSEDDPTQIHVYRTSAGSVTRVSDVDGVHVAAGRAETCVVSSWSLEHAGPKVSVRRDGAAVPIASHTADPGITPNLRMLTVGERDLRCALLLPTGYQPTDGPLPVLLDPYGGPHAQRVLHTRNAFLTSQWFADQGFAVLIADGRGSPGRGPAWEKEIGGALAEVSLTDQVDALHAVAAQQSELDTSKVAIRGWSYGGYLSALAVLRRPDVFHAGIAGAPVTDWSLYDTHYTERYLGHPAEQAESYQRNSLIDAADRLERSLLIVHGLADDNVFVAHALRLSSALLAAGKWHDFLPLVGTTHMTPSDEVVAENLLHLQVDWLKRELGIG